MDKIDRNLLRILMENSRVSTVQIAKKLKVSREVATYRLERLKRNKVILGFIAEIDIEKLGFIGAAVFVNVKATRQKDFKRHLSLTDYVSWVAELSGIWSFGFSVVGRDNKELDEKFHEIYEKFKDDIIDYRFTLHKKSTFFYEKYFGGTKRTIRKRKNHEYNIDSKDIIILNELSRNSRATSVYLSWKLSLTAPAVAQRIRNLEKSGHIKKYSIFVDVSRLGLYQYSIFIINKDINEKQRILSYLEYNKNISFIAEYIGDPFIEFGLFVRNPYELREKLQEIEERFPNNRVIEVSLFQKEFVSIGPPKCVFGHYKP